MKFQLIAPTLVFTILAGCSAPPKNISCMYEKGTTEWSDGSTKNITSNLGTDTFTWNESDNSVQVKVMQGGKYEEIKVPATLNGTDLAFSAPNRTSYIINTTSGKVFTTTTGEDSEDGTFVMKYEGTCSGF
jgi:hypothetical protein